jgi:hypothetical protein
MYLECGMVKKAITVLSFFCFGCTLPKLDRVLLDINLLLLLLKQSAGPVEISVDKPSLQVLRRFEPVVVSSNPPGVPIFYTTDGSEPTVDSFQVGEEFYPNNIAPGQIFKVKAIRPSGVGSNTLELRYLYPYLRTGQTNCYNYSTDALEPCDATHTDQDGRLQKGMVPQFRPNYTNPGFPNDYITTDDVFGLKWTSCPLGRTGSDCLTGTITDVAGSITNPEDQCASLNSANANQGFAGIKDWRLPEPMELVSIPIFNLSPPIIFDSAAFPNLNSAVTIHSARTAFDPTKRYFFNVTQRFYGPQPDTFSRKLLCVSGPAHPIPRYTDLGDGTTRDELRGLLWTKCLAGQTLPTCSGVGTGLTFSDAIDYCRSLSLGGKTWRLPNLRELDTLTNPYEIGLPKIYPKDIMSNLGGAVLRSSTAEAANAARRVTVNSPTNSGGGAASSKTDSTVKAICVADAW